MIHRLILFLGFSIMAETSLAAGITPSILDPTSLNNSLPNNVASESLKTFGIYFAHRPYQGAISMYDSNSMDLKMEVTMMKIGDGFFDAMSANNLTPPPNMISLPSGKFHLRKAFSPAVDLGASGIFFMGQYAVGGDMKIELQDPEEGLSSAIRLGYSYATARQYFLKNLHVISPELVFSRRLNFAEPYLGVGGRVIFGTISIDFTTPLTITTIEKGALAYTYYAFTGVSFQILGSKGLRLGMEGTFDFSGFSSLGTIFGIAF